MRQDDLHTSDLHTHCDGAASAAVAPAWTAARRDPGWPRHVDVPVVSRPGALAAWQLRQATDWMRAHLGLSISIADVAAQLKLSPSYFARAFRAATGQPPHQWLLQRRIELALQLLGQPSLPLGEIASLCGFADQAHFSRVFSARLGMPPSHWRARHAG